MALFGELDLEEAMDVSQSRLRDYDDELDTKAGKFWKPDAKQTPPFVQFDATNKYLIYFGSDSKCSATKQKVNKTLLKYILLSKYTTVVYWTSNQKTEVNQIPIRARRATETLSSIPGIPSKQKLNIHEHTWGREQNFFNIRNGDIGSA